MEPSQFKLSAASLKNYRKNLLLKSIIITLVGTTVGLIIAIKNSNKEFDPITFCIAIFSLIIVYSFSLRKTYRRQRELLESYKLTIDSNTIKRKQKNTPDIHIYKSEVTEIIKGAKCYYIKTTDASNPIMIPKGVQNREELEIILAGVKPFSTKMDIKFSSKYNLGLSVLFLGLIVACFTTTNKIIATVTGVILLALIVYMLIEGQRSKNIDQRTKRGLLWLVLIGLAAGARTIILWWGTGS